MLHSKHTADPGGRAIWAFGLRPLVRWDCGFEFFRGMDVYLLWVLCVVRWSSLQRADPSSSGVLPSVCVSLCVISCNNNPPHLNWLVRERSDEERQKERKKIKTLHPQPGIMALRKIVACCCGNYIKYTCSFCERYVKITNAGIGVPCSSRYILKCWSYLLDYI